MVQPLSKDRRFCSNFLDNTYLLSGEDANGVPIKRTDARMRVKLFVEPSGKAREEVVLESCVPLIMEQVHAWTESWISIKEYKKWSKESNSSRMLGEYRTGKIVEATLLTPEGDSSLKSNLLACRSYTLDDTGAKKKLPMVLFTKLKKTIDYDYFAKRMNPNAEQEAELKEVLKPDVWAPVSVWNPQSIDRAHIVDVAEVLPFAVQYTKALFNLDPEAAGLTEFIETEVLKC